MHAVPVAGGFGLSGRQALQGVAADRGCFVAGNGVNILPACVNPAVQGDRLITD